MCGEPGRRTKRSAITINHQPSRTVVDCVHNTVNVELCTQLVKGVIMKQQTNQLHVRISVPLSQQLERVGQKVGPRKLSAWIRRKLEDAAKQELKR